MYLDVFHLQLVGSLPADFAYVSDQVREWSTCRSALMLSPQEDLPRNRLINVFNIGKTSAGSENETNRCISIKIIFL